MTDSNHKIPSANLRQFGGAEMAGDQVDGLDRFAEDLAGIHLHEPDSALLRRLEAALTRADAELRDEQLSRIITMAEFTPEAPLTGRSSLLTHSFVNSPFLQWSAAAAALVFALGVAFESTRFVSPASEVVAAKSPVSVGRDLSSARPVYQIVDGRLVPAGNSSSLMRASYHGIRVIDGKAYRHFQNGERILCQPVGTEAAEADPVTSTEK